MRHGHLGRGAESVEQVVHHFPSKFSGTDQEHFVTGQQIPLVKFHKKNDGGGLPSKAKRQAEDIARHEP